MPLEKYFVNIIKTLKSEQNLFKVLNHLIGVVIFIILNEKRGTVFLRILQFSFRFRLGFKKVTMAFSKFMFLPLFIPCNLGVITEFHVNFRLFHLNLP